MRLKKLVPGLQRVQRTTDSGRHWVYQLPSLQDARDDFAEAVGQLVDWED
jgi:hypothetical protein